MSDTPKPSKRGVFSRLCECDFYGGPTHIIRSALNWERHVAYQNAQKLRKGPEDQPNHAEHEPNSDSEKGENQDTIPISSDEDINASVGLKPRGPRKSRFRQRRVVKRLKIRSESRSSGDESTADPVIVASTAPPVTARSSPPKFKLPISTTLPRFSQTHASEHVDHDPLFNNDYEFDDDFLNRPSSPLLDRNELHGKDPSSPVGPERTPTPPQPKLPIGVPETQPDSPQTHEPVPKSEDEGPPPSDDDPGDPEDRPEDPDSPYNSGHESGESSSEDGEHDLDYRNIKGN